MLFKILDKEEFKKLVAIMVESLEVIGPRKVSTDKNGEPIHHYVPVKSLEEMDLGYETTEYSAKTYFLPYKEDLSRYHFSDKDWTQEVEYYVRPRVIMGLHACDINALVKLDKVMARDFFPSPYYVSRRKNTFVVGIDHPPCKGGFCRSLGTDTVRHGFDLFLTDLGDRYFVAIDSARGLNLAQMVRVCEVSERDTEDYLEVRRRNAEGFDTIVNMHNVANLLDIEFESEVWNKFGDMCLSCGSCAMVCPTCYCYGVSERVSMDFTKGAKVKQLHSCNLLDFAEVAGGHNFRSDRGTRLKYRYYHQHCGFAEAYDEPKCVGCNRCGRACFSGINPPEVVRELQAEKRA